MTCHDKTSTPVELAADLEHSHRIACDVSVLVTTHYFIMGAVINKCIPTLAFVPVKESFSGEMITG